MEIGLKETDDGGVAERRIGVAGEGGRVEVGKGVGRGHGRRRSGAKEEGRWIQG
jgi:hypothetical protein